MLFQDLSSDPSPPPPISSTYPAVAAQLVIALACQQARLGLLGRHTSADTVP